MILHSCGSRNRLILELTQDGESETKLVCETEAIHSCCILADWICRHGCSIQGCTEQGDEQLCACRLPPCSCLIRHCPFCLDPGQVSLSLLSPFCVGVCMSTCFVHMSVLMFNIILQLFSQES